MNAKKLVYAIALVLYTISCKKTEVKDNLNTTGIDIVKATKSSYFYEVRIINDEDANKEKLTKESEFFVDCDKPELTFSKNNSYTLNYYNKVTGKLIKEIGTWNTNTTTNELVMYRPLKRYNLLILKMDEEDFIISYEIKTTVSTTNSEGTVTTSEQVKPEILYMEDND